MDVSVQPIDFFLAIVSLCLLRLFCFLMPRRFRDSLTLIIGVFLTAIAFQLETLLVVQQSGFVHICVTAPSPELLTLAKSCSFPVSGDEL